MLRRYSVAVHARKVQSIRNFLLDRPKQLNALNLEMIYTMTPQLIAWQESDLCKVIVISSADPKAFCAGGDVKTVVQLAQKKDPKALEFFEQEYKLNHLIATSKKPYVAILNGITMGGGVGLSVHGHFRIVTENTLFAMPETAIGLYPDVGGSFFLPRMDGELGTFLGLTGHRLKGKDAFIAGIGTHYVPSARLPALMQQLAELETDELQVVNQVIDEFSEPLSLESFENWTLGGNKRDIINECFKYDTIEEILQSLEQKQSESEPELKEWIQKQLTTLKQVSPTSLKITLAQLRKGAKMTIADCFKMEHRLVSRVLEQPDFIEGVTAKLISKPARDPVWKPQFKDLHLLTPNVIESMYFEPKETDPKLTLFNRLTYYDYPHRTLSGLPTDKDIRRVVEGTARRGFTQIPPLTKKEALDWVRQNWGRFDSGVVGEVNTPLKITLDGGSGRGKVSLVEKTTSLLNRHTKETPQGLVWVQ
ncbi:ClpP/crotonase-like domain-containing protein [Gorgonomyces haynaldii]|nr:ClpP/crotonase-like domain-containing protein [Gorgonomyces haynaldii]